METETRTETDLLVVRSPLAELIPADVTLHMRTSDAWLIVGALRAEDAESTLADTLARALVAQS